MNDLPWPRLTARFDPSATEWRVVETADDGARLRVRPQLRYEAVLRRLDEVLGRIGWSNDLRPVAGGVAAALTIGGVTKSVAVDSPHGDGVRAAHDAFVRTAERFGLVPAADPALEYWVDGDPQSGEPLFDPEFEAWPAPAGVPREGFGVGRGVPAQEVGTGADGGGPRGEAGSASGTGGAIGAADGMIAVATADTSPDSSIAPARPTEVVPEEPKSAGQQAIDRLLERLRADGRGLEAAKLVVQHGGYGSDPQAARELYARLRALLIAGDAVRS